MTAENSKLNIEIDYDRAVELVRNGLMVFNENLPSMVLKVDGPFGDGEHCSLMPNPSVGDIQGYIGIGVRLICRVVAENEDCDFAPRRRKEDRRKYTFFGFCVKLSGPRKESKHSFGFGVGSSPLEIKDEDIKSAIKELVEACEREYLYEEDEGHQ